MRRGYSTVHQLALYLGVSDRTVERWYADGKIPEPECRGTQSAKLWSEAQRREILTWHLKKQKQKS